MRFLGFVVMILAYLPRADDDVSTSDDDDNGSGGGSYNDDDDDDDFSFGSTDDDWGYFTLSTTPPPSSPPLTAPEIFQSEWYEGGCNSIPGSAVARFHAHPYRIDDSSFFEESLFETGIEKVTNA